MNYKELKMRFLLCADMAANLSQVKRRRHMAAYEHTTWRMHMWVCMSARVCARVCVCVHVCARACACACE